MINFNYIIGYYKIIINYINLFNFLIVYNVSISLNLYHTYDVLCKLIYIYFMYLHCDILSYYKFKVFKLFTI